MGQSQKAFSDAGLRVRILLPPAQSQERTAERFRASISRKANSTSTPEAAAQSGASQPVQTVPQPGSVEWFEAQKQQD